MGLEATVKATHKTLEAIGKLHVDSTTLGFTSKELKWSVTLSPAITASAKAGILTVKNGRDKATFEIGESAERWVDKILNPPSRMTKLGVKANMKYWAEGGFDTDFFNELEQQSAVAVRDTEQCDIGFWRVENKRQLSKLEGIKNKLKPKVNIWIVWPKGSSTITQGDVMSATAELGMGPSKTAAFDANHSSMRFATRV